MYKVYRVVFVLLFYSALAARSEERRVGILLSYVYVGTQFARNVFDLVIGELLTSRVRLSTDLAHFFQAEDGIRDGHVTGVQTCALPICVIQPALFRACQRPDPSRSFVGGVCIKCTELFLCCCSTLPWQLDRKSVV